jgi:hypothetical protein
VALEKVFGLAEIVLGAESNDGDLVCVLLSELLNPRGLRVTRGSMRGPEPDQDRFAAIHDGGKRIGLPIGDVCDVHDWQRVE